MLSVESVGGGVVIQRIYDAQFRIRGRGCC